MKVVIFTGIGGFGVNDVVAWHLILHNGWEVVELEDEAKIQSFLQILSRSLKSSFFT
jgi:hypothetical protein